MRCLCPALALPLLATALSAQAPPAAIARLQAVRPQAERTQVMVLGTLHLRALGKDFKPELVAPLLQELEAYKPDAILVEDRPGAWIHTLELRRKASDVNEMLIERFCKPDLEMGHEAQALLKLDMMQAAREWRAKPAPTQGGEALVRHALLSLAAYESACAALAWSRLAPGDPARSQMPEKLAQQLDRLVADPGEIFSIAVPLARRLGHGEVIGVDDFEAPERLLESFMAYSKGVKTSDIYKKAQETPARKTDQAHLAAAVKAGNLRPYYAWLNGSAYQAPDVEQQWGVLLRTNFPDASDRTRVALWENRNLKIAAHIRAAAARFPGKRLLVIYGTAHKPFLDAYLGVCSDLKVVQPLEALKLK